MKTNGEISKTWAFFIEKELYTDGLKTLLGIGYEYATQYGPPIIENNVILQIRLYLFVYRLQKFTIFDIRWDTLQYTKS